MNNVIKSLRCCCVKLDLVYNLTRFNELKLLSPEALDTGIHSKIRKETSTFGNVDSRLLRLMYWSIRNAFEKFSFPFSSMMLPVDRILLRSRCRSRHQTYLVRNRSLDNRRQQGFLLRSIETANTRQQNLYKKSDIIPLKAATIFGEVNKVSYVNYCDLCKFKNPR